MTFTKARKMIRLIMPVFALSFLGWQFYSMQAKDVDDSFFENDTAVEVINSVETIAFKPTTDTLGVGFLFYPGALVDPDAYVPMARQIAEAGYEARIIKIPYRMTGMEWQKKEVEARTTSALLNNKKWVLSGHSRGVRMALAYAADNESSLAGLILIGSSHPREVDHTGLGIPVMKVYGTRDGLASPEEVEQFKHNLPAHTSWVRIEGGNHAQFGWYGGQLGDDDATISRVDQQKQLLAAIDGFLGRL
ncbi:MAG: alpha/beta family hydrolase [Rhodothermales bacterium]